VEDGQSDRTYTAVPWRRIIRYMADEYRFTPQQVGQMTMYQIRVLMSSRDRLGSGRYKVNPMTASDARVRKVGRSQAARDTEWNKAKRQRYQERLKGRIRKMQKEQQLAARRRAEDAQQDR